MNDSCYNTYFINLVNFSTSFGALEKDDESKFLLIV